MICWAWLALRLLFIIWTGCWLEDMTGGRMLPPVWLVILGMPTERLPTVWLPSSWRTNDWGRAYWLETIMGSCLITCLTT